MILKANIQEAFRSLMTAKQRTLLALIGIVIGIGSVIGMVSIGTIVQHEVLKNFKDMGVDIMKGRPDTFQDGKGALDVKQLFEIPSRIPEIVAVAPFTNSGFEFARAGEKKYIGLFGVTAAFFNINKLRVGRGRLLSDLDENRYFCMIGCKTAEFLKQTGIAEPLGAQISFGHRIFTVVGILDKVSIGGGLRPSGLNEAMLVHLSTATRIINNPGDLSFLARSSGGVRPKLLSQKVANFLESGSKGLKVHVETAEELISQMQKQMQLFTLLLGAIGSISLIVGGIGVMNVMLISVSERRREIGLRRALGAQQGDIQSQFVIESIVLCIVGGIIGILLGIAVSYAFARFYNWGFIVSYQSVVLGFGVATAIGLFFGYYPARSAAKLDPIKALRS